MELINRNDALAVAMHSKNPVEGIKNLPAVDAVEVVRCKDCKHYKRYDDEIEGVTWQGLCNYGEFFTDDYDFCSRGERKDGE